MHRALGALFGLLLSCLAPAARGAVVDRLAAVVGDDPITWTEIYELGGDHIEQGVAAAPAGQREAVRRQLELEVLDALVDRRLVQQEMRRLGIDVTAEDLDRALDDIASQNGLDRESLRHEIQRAGIEWETYLDELRATLRQMKFDQQVLAPRVTVREDEILARYRQEGRSLGGPPTAHLLGVLVPVEGEGPEAREAARQRAQAIYEELKGGASFAEVAARLGVEPYASTGGDMGTFRQGQLAVPELDRQAFSLPLGEPGPPVETPAGYAIIEVLERRAPEPPPLEEVRDRLQQEILQQKVEQERERWLARARRRTAVRVLLEPPEQLGG